jgi:hypothetical protein
MELSEIIGSAVDVGNVCDQIFSGIEEIYLVEIGDGFSTDSKPEVLTDFPEITKPVYHFVLEPEASEFKSKPIKNRSGFLYSNTVAVKSIRNVSDWLNTNRYKKFWLIIKQGGTRWLVTGDDKVPFTIVGEFDGAKKMEEGQSWDFLLQADQLRPYFIYEP